MTIHPGERIRRLRDHKGLSQEGLAKSAGIGVATLSRIENGQTALQGTLTKIAHALGVGVADLLYQPPVPKGMRVVDYGKAGLWLKSEAEIEEDANATPLRSSRAQDEVDHQIGELYRQASREWPEGIWGVDSAREDRPEWVNEFLASIEAIVASDGTLDAGDKERKPAWVDEVVAASERAGQLAAAAIKQQEDHFVAAVQEQREAYTALVREMMRTMTALVSEMQGLRKDTQGLREDLQQAISGPAVDVEAEQLPPRRNVASSMQDELDAMEREANERHAAEQVRGRDEAV